MKYKKQRGQNRKLIKLKENIEQIHPFQNTDCRYENFHVPCSQFISSPKTSGKIKTEFCKVWLDKTSEIIKQKPSDLSFCKVIAVIDEENLWNSQIIIFYDKNYYNSFWSRNSAEQTWNLIDKEDISFIEKRCIKSDLKEKGYYETVVDLDSTRKTTLWFYGDVK